MIAPTAPSGTSGDRPPSSGVHRKASGTRYRCWPIRVLAITRSRSARDARTPSSEHPVSASAAAPDRPDASPCGTGSAYRSAWRGPRCGVRRRAELPPRRPRKRRSRPQRDAARLGRGFIQRHRHERSKRSSRLLVQKSRLSFPNDHDGARLGRGDSTDASGEW
jgi:hypothetical protein